MDHHDIALTIAVRVCILLGGASMSSPAGMADTECSIQRAASNGILEIAQLALGAPDRELGIVTKTSQSRRIVAPILQPLQSLKDDGYGAMRSNITYDSTHGLIIGAHVRPKLWFGEREKKNKKKQEAYTIQ